MNTSRNQGGIKRGDRKDTGDLEARPKEGVGPGGSGVPGGAGGSTGNPTANSDALESSSTNTNTRIADVGSNGETEELTVREADDPELGLTGTSEVATDDWVTETGATRTGEASSQGVDRKLADKDQLPGGREVTFEKRRRK
jgi:hypothetical protein